MAAVKESLKFSSTSSEEKAKGLQFGSHELYLETGNLASQANGSCLVKWGDIVVLVSATASKEPREDADFLPLLVDYEEKMYAAGKIPGGFFKREGRPSEQAILTARLIDRSLRPLFPKDLRHDIQIVATTLSADQQYDPDVPALIGASAAIAFSDIPFCSTVGAVRVGRIQGEFILNPSFEQLEKGTLDLVISATREKVVVLEAGAVEEAEETILQAIDFAYPTILQVIDFIEELKQKHGMPKFSYEPRRLSAEAAQLVESLAIESVREALTRKSKIEMDEIFRQGSLKIKKTLEKDFPSENPILASELYEEVKRREVRRFIKEEKRRPDGRSFDEIRDIQIQVNFLPRAHGSALFQRGLTQVMTIATLGAPGEEQIIENLTPDEYKRFLHQYNFPGYSTGEVKPIRSPGRREVGHGALAERALYPMIPPKEVFPYTIRLVSEVISSNGSTSMASVCGSTLALMDAGVPIQRPVAGVALGLLEEGSEYFILTDIQGLEDAVGDMDFKVAGSEVGITAIQLDVKIPGLTREIIREALEKARLGRLFILSKIKEVLPAPRSELSPRAPHILIFSVPPERIGGVIGTGGKNIRKITDETGAKVDIEDDGRIFVTAENAEVALKVQSMIRNLIREVEIGKIYRGKVKRLMSFGALVEILHGKVGLLHISEIPDSRGKDVHQLLKTGEEVAVKVLDYDDDTGKISLSMKGFVQHPKRER